MILLYVTGGDDYMALQFEDKYFRDGKTAKTFYEEMVAQGVTSKDIEIEGTEIQIYIKEFGTVDPKFVEWVRDEIQDYDDSKNSNFYIIKE